MNSADPIPSHTDTISPVFTILHTNDFHNHFTDFQAEKLRKRRLDLGNSGLLLDAGDAVGSGNITFLPGGEPILDRMNAAGYDAMSVGNREFHFSSIGFRAKLSRAKFPVLCANIRLNQSGESPPDDVVNTAQSGLPVTSHKIFETKTGNVLVFGLTVPMITVRMAVRKVSAFIFEDPIHFASAYVPQMLEKYRPDLVIALTHIGIKQDRLLAESVPGIDLIISGHTHVVLEQGERVQDTLIVQTGCFGKFFGTVEVYEDDSANGYHLSARLEEL